MRRLRWKHERVLILLYKVDDSDIKVNAILKDETIWLSQKGMAELFDVEVPAISKHHTNVFVVGELSEDATVSKMEIVQQEGKRQVKRQVKYYSLDAIISAGYMVNSKRATHFRIWATKVLKEYMIKGLPWMMKGLSKEKLLLERIILKSY